MFYVFHIVSSFVDMFYTSMNIFYKQNIQHDFASIDILGWLTVVKKALIATNPKKIFLFFSIWVFCHEHSRITGLQEKGEGISLTPHYHFHPLHRHLDISRAITAESSPLHIANSWTRTGKSVTTKLRAQKNFMKKVTLQNNFFICKDVY